MEDCKLCQALVNSRRQSVPSWGNKNSSLYFIGEAPGKEEDKLGVPFVGRSGALLRRLITVIFDIEPRDTYILNVVKCRPESNRTPYNKEIRTCFEQYLEKELDTSHKIIITLGRIPWYALMGFEKKMKDIHGRKFSYNNHALFPTYHPAAVVRNNSLLETLKNDLRTVNDFYKINSLSLS